MSATAAVSGSGTEIIRASLIQRAVRRGTRRARRRFTRHRLRVCRIELLLRADMIHEGYAARDRCLSLAGWLKTAQFRRVGCGP
jgi:hypothetical protein